MKFPTSNASIALARTLLLLVCAALTGHAALAADPARGQRLWNTPGASGVNMCSDCHGVRPGLANDIVWNASGTPADQGAPSVIRNRISIQRDMFEFASWPDTDLADLAAYINAVRYGKNVGTPALSNEDCLFSWAESQLPSVFKAPAIQRGSLETINYRIYDAGGVTNAIGHNTADSQVLVLAPALGFASPVALGGVTSASLFSASRAAGCR